MFCVPQHMAIDAMPESLWNEPTVTSILFQQHYRDIRQALLPGGWLYFLQHQDNERKWGLISEVFLCACVKFS